MELELTTNTTHKHIIIIINYYARYTIIHKEVKSHNTS